MSLNPLVLWRSRAYRKTFNNPEGKKVLADLRRFCRATLPSADVNNVQTTYLLEGRREVWLRIMGHLNMTDEDIMNLVEEPNNFEVNT
jgi:hypothetical protein